MSLDYDKISRNKETPQTSMSSYSDLFAALAFIFLFLYVISTLQLSLQAISSKIEVKKYEAKLHSYEIPSYTPNPKQINYDKIFAKLAFLENQTNEEVEMFYKQVQEFKKHEKELISNYQSVVSHVKRENDDMVVALKQQRLITKNQKTEFDTKIANKEREYVDNLHGLRNQLTQSEKNLQKLAEGKKTIVAEKASLLSEREKLEKDFMRTHAKVQLLKKEKEVVKAEKEKLLIARQNMKKEITESKTRLHVLEQAKKAAVNEKERIIIAQNDLKRELKKSRAKLQTLEKGKEAVSSEKKILIAARQRLETKLSESRSRLLKLEKSKSEAIAEKKKLQASEKRFQNELNQRKKRLQKLEKDRAAGIYEKEKLLTAQNKMKNELGRSRAKLMALEKGKDAIENEKEKLVSDRKGLREKLEKSITSLQALGKGKKAAEAEKEKLAASRKGLQEKFEKTRQKLRDLQKSEKAVHAEKEKLAAIGKKLEGEKEKLEKLGKSKKADIAEKKAALAARKKLENELDETRKKLQELEKYRDDADTEKDKLVAEQQKLQRKLGDYQEKDNLRNNIVARLKENFKKHAIDAEINEDTGEVVLPFEKAFFKFDSDQLSEKMKNYLQKIIPIYARSIFGKENIYQHIKSIEVVGYASPIYRGKYVNPKSLSTEARAALNYNMDLSYRRAHSIFRYILNKDNIDFKYQKDLMLYLKVAGRSYLETAPTGISLAGNIDMRSFCKQYDCEKLQNAIIRFNLVE